MAARALHSLLTNPATANADYTGPLGFVLGSCNNLRGPGYATVDL